MNKYKVWETSKVRSSEDHAVEVEAFSPEEAAETYADDDVDGGIDGIYSLPGGHPLSVRSPDGTVHRFTITVDYVPQFYVHEVK